MAQGERSDTVLGELAVQYDRDERTIQRWISDARAARDQQAIVVGAKVLTLTAHYADLADTSKRMIDMLLIPSPRSFWVFNLSYGEYHGWEGCGLQWFCRPDSAEVEVSFADFRTDGLLERETLFQPIMSHLPDICEQYEKLKAITGEYIRKCHQLLSSIIGDARQAVVRLAEGRVSDPKQLRDFLNAKASEKALLVEYDDKGAVILYRDFATTIYDDAVVYAEYKHEQTHGEYVFDSGWGMLKYRYYDLAMGSDSDMQRLLDVHKELRVQYCKSPLAKDLLDCYHDLREVQHGILTTLRMRILKRVFPGSCDLCPGPES
jgi:hypothetical protein